MSDEITEALLEMHYHRAIVDAFATEFGARFLRMLKPSAQQEMWVGFDQGWVHTSLSTRELYEALNRTISNNDIQIGDFHFGYFLQFKVVRNLQRRSSYTPDGFSTPYLRSELSVWRNPKTGLSQHETLRRLASIQGAEVYYACPLLFNIDAIYEYPDLNTLQIVDVISAPPDIDDTGRHFIAFQSPSDANPPMWCSEPFPAKGFRCSEWTHNETFKPRRRTGREVLELIEQSKGALSEMDHRRALILPSLPKSLTILSFSI